MTVTPLPYHRLRGRLRHHHRLRGAGARCARPPRCARRRVVDPLRPVTVVVPTNTAGVMARRALGRRGGFAAVDVRDDVPPRRAARGAGPRTRRPQAGVDTGRRRRRAPGRCTANPGLYDGVQHHPSTIVALRDLYRELRVAGPGAVTALARTERGGEPARVAAEVMRTLRTGLVRRGRPAGGGDQPRRQPTCPTGCRGSSSTSPSGCDRSSCSCCGAIGERGAVDVVVGLTGDEEADADVLAAAEALADGPVPDAPPGHRRPTSTRRLGLDVVSTTDADDEVRIAVRAVVDAARAGTRFDRIAILFPSDRPYARLVEHQLDAAGVPWNGRPGTTVAERMAPRVLAELLELDRRGLRRTELMALARRRAGRARRQQAPTAQWERIGRDAGVVRGERLGAGADPLRRRGPPAQAAAGRSAAASRPTPRSPCCGSSPSCSADLGDPASLRPWAEWRAWAVARCSSAGSVPGRLDRLDGAEGQAWTQTCARPRPPRAPRRHRRAGHPRPSSAPRSWPSSTSRRGVTASSATASTSARWPGPSGSTSTSSSCSARAEGLLPPAPVTDPLLGDRERAAAGLAPVRPPRRARAPPVPRRHHHHATGPRHRSPRRPPGDRGPAAHPLARPAAPGRRRAGRRRRTPQGLAGHGVPGVGGRAPPPRAVGLRPRRRRRPRSPGRDRATPCCVERWRCATPGPGRLHRLRRQPHRRIDVPALPPLVSPTQLEAWTACPHAYFVRYVLGVRPIEEPADVETARRRPTGARRCTPPSTALHRAVIDGGCRSPGPTGWGPATSQLLQQACAEVGRRRSSCAVARAGRRSGPTTASELPHDARRVGGRRERRLARRSRSSESERRFDAGADGGADPARRSAVGVQGFDRPRRGAPRRAPRRHRPQVGQARGWTSCRATIPPSGPPTSSCRSTRRRPGPRSIDPTPTSRPGTRSSRPGSGGRSIGVRRRRLGAGRRGPGARRRRHRSRRVPGPTRAGRRSARGCRAATASPTGSARHARWDEWERKRHAPELARWFGEPTPGRGRRRWLSSQQTLFEVVDWHRTGTGPAAGPGGP